MRFRQMPRLARQVLINVLANLIAAAIIYLLGLATGIFPRVDTLVLVAALVLTCAAAAVPHALADAQPRRKRRWVRRGAYGSIAFGSVMVGSATYILIAWQPLGWVAGASLAVPICIGVWAIGDGVWAINKNPLPTPTGA
jgi:hypothetical protein